MNYSTIFTIVMLTCCQILMSGCLSHDMSELQEYTDDILARPGGHIEPIPTMEPYENYIYQSGKENKRDPFLPFYIDTDMDKKKHQKTGLTPEQIAEIDIRNKEELERFELDSLHMVGTLQHESEKQIWGIILDPEGLAHRVKPGNYIGLNTGKIINIFKNRIELRELVQIEEESWAERKASIALVEG